MTLKKMYHDSKNLKIPTIFDDNVKYKIPTFNHDVKYKYHDSKNFKILTFLNHGIKDKIS